FAVSMKFPPRSMKRAMMASDSETLDPQPQSSPKVMAPRQKGLTRSPEFPRGTYWSSDIGSPSITWRPLLHFDNDPLDVLAGLVHILVHLASRHRRLPVRLPGVVARYRFPAIGRHRRQVAADDA